VRLGTVDSIDAFVEGAVLATCFSLGSGGSDAPGAFSIEGGPPTMGWFRAGGRSYCATWLKA
jgi:hypothetical protein